MNVRLFIMLLFYSSAAIAQISRPDSYKKELKNLSGIQRINKLLDIAELHFLHEIHSDSALKYAQLAYNESSTINYKTGKGKALIQQSAVYGSLLGNVNRMHLLSTQAIEELKSSNDFENLAVAHHKLSISLIWQGKYDEANTVLAAAKKISMQFNDKEGLCGYYQYAGIGFVKQGQLWKGFEALSEAERIGKEIGDSLTVSLSLGLIGRAFNNSGDLENALKYYRESQTFKNTNFFSLWPHLEDMGYVFLKLRQYDSAVFYQQKHRRNLMTVTSDTAVTRRFRVWQSPDFSIDLKIAQKKFDDVLILLEPRLKDQEKKGDQLPLMHSLLNIGYAYAGKNDYKISVKKIRSLIALAEASRNQFYLREGYELMASNFEKLKLNDSAYIYLGAHISTKEAMAKDQFALRAALYSAKEQFGLRLDSLNKIKAYKEDLLALKQKELRKESRLKDILLISLIIMTLFSISIFRNISLKRKNDRLQNEQIQLELKRRGLELEMQALRAQMNPHFIFNCLSAIDNLVQTNQADKATSYLSRFAKLIRSVLDSSKNNVVTFQRDFETLKLYLEMEKFRCNNKFSYTIIADEKLMNGDYKVPPLIIQPFVENAIHHGLLNKQGSDRQLNITAALQDEHIVYYVSDNGIGRKHAEALKEMNRPDHVSYGIDITRDRLNIYNKNGANDIQITDLEHNGISIGTRAMVRIHN